MCTCTTILYVIRFILLSMDHPLYTSVIHTHIHIHKRLMSPWKCIFLSSLFMYIKKEDTKIEI